MSNAAALCPLARSATTGIALVVLALSSGTAGAQVARADGTTALANGQALLSGPPFERTLTLEDRLQAQRAIEEVYWRHRIWPKENPQPKPPLPAVMSDEAIRAKVEDYLRKSNALEQWWKRSITASQLQAEMDRMAKHSRDPQMLRELYAALGNDAFLIAETLARPTLVDRLIHNWYANDDRFHGATRRQAEEALSARSGAGAMHALGGEYGEQRLARRQETTSLPREGREGGVVELDAEGWDNWRERTARQLGSEVDAIPIGRVSALQEEADRFFVTALLSLDADNAWVAGVSWPKRSFDSWWAEERAGTSVQIEAASGAYSVRTPDVMACTDDTWAPWGSSASFAPSPRGDHTAVWTGSEMIVWGGRSSSSSPYLNTGERYDPATDSWTPTSTGANVPAARGSHTAVWTGAEMIVWGGTAGSSTYLNTGGRYDPASDSWAPTSTGGDVPSARSQHTAVWTGTDMIVWGGSSGSNLSSGGRYDPSSDTWMPTSTDTNVPAAQSLHTAVWTGTEMIVWGGNSNTGGRYDPSSDSWAPTSTGADVPASRNGHTAVWTGTEMIVWGGTSNFHIVNTGGRYDPASDSWTPTSLGSNVPQARRSPSAVWTGSEMVIWGGYGGGNLNTGGRYDPAADNWTPTSAGANVPDGRADHTAAWTGTEMIVWGGNIGATNLNTGGRYDPVTDTWTRTSTGTSDPDQRADHTAVWTGAEMIIWGGWGGTAGTIGLDTGGRYDPAMDSWTPTSSGANVPEPRRHHTAVWTGTKMIVWGGENPLALNSGGRYDPASDTWTPTSMGVDVPTARYGQTAVWTGLEMILWGGFGGGDFPVAGGRYEPTTDIWLPTSTGANVPEGRNQHRAVWTGTEMIVWGGQRFGENLATGGRYDPSSDSWTPTSTGANVPTARQGHTAVWAGLEMIVWGGNSNTGGRYDPASDSWTPTSTGANVPASRNGHTAVWTGTEMIVWGGGILLNTGGRYNPASDTWVATSTGTNVPFARRLHTAVWTGKEMIVWGGGWNNGGRYCACDGDSVSTWYPDADGDGYGVSSASVPSCSQPPGYVAVGGDCDDNLPGAYPGATESCNGIDDDCDGVTDEVSETAGFTNPADRNEFSWPAHAGATLYEVIRSTSPAFTSGCVTFTTTATAHSDAELPPGGTSFFYLVRTLTPFTGSWGQDSSGAERVIVCFTCGNSTCDGG